MKTKIYTSHNIMHSGAQPRAPECPKVKN